VAEEKKYYTVDEAAPILRLSPARIRQMLRSGELGGERRPSRVEGVLGSWRIPEDSISAFQERPDAAATVALPPGEGLTDRPSGASQAEVGLEAASDAPSDASERLSESVRELREKAEGLLEELGRLDSRLESAEIQESALRQGMRREKERANRLEAELEAERSRRGGEERSGWRRLFGA